MKENKKQKVFKNTFIIFVIILFTGISSLLFVIIFSVYPSYILRANHGRIFRYGQKISNSIVDIVGFEKGKSKIWLESEYPNPNKINQPIIYTKKPNDLPAEIFINHAKGEYLYHSPMMPDPFATFSLLPGRYYSAVNSIQQFRYKEILGKKEKAEYRIFITGGSTAWGALAPNNESTIGGFLEKILNEKQKVKKIKVITAAAGAWNSTQERIWIFNRITEYEPDLIISYSGHNDIYDWYQRKENIFNSYWYDGEYYFNAIIQYEKFNRGIDLVDSILSYRKEMKKFYKDDFPRKTIKNIQIINAYLKTVHCSYYYVLQPIRKNDREKISKEYEKLKIELVKFDKEEKNFSFYDHSDLFDNSRNIFFDRCHIGDRGNLIIAENLSKIILARFQLH